MATASDPFLTAALFGNIRETPGRGEIGEEDPPNPVQKFFAAVADQRSQEPTSLVKYPTAHDPAWDEPIGRELGKRGTPVTFAKGSLGYRLGIVRVEQETIDGENWIRGFNAGGNLVDARVIAP